MSDLRIRKRLATALSRLNGYLNDLPERSREELVPDTISAYDSYLRVVKIEYNQIQRTKKLLKKLNQQWDELRQSLDDKRLAEEQKLYEETVRKGWWK
uniref:Translin n=1 Tax=Syphacia muris TaxID=451379 RepID=A0A0N5ARH6_9BILA